MNWCRTAIIFLFFCLIFPANLMATPMTELRYVETDLGGGFWKYDYKFYNSSDPIADAGTDMYDAMIYFDSLSTFTLLSIPAGWDIIDGAGFAELFSLSPGASPFGTDIAPGELLGGFSFMFDYRAGNLAFDAMLVNPADPFSPIVVSGVTAPDASTAAPIPEPGSMLLVGTGIALIAGLARRKGQVSRQ